MSKKVLILSSSLRGGSNSEILARECFRGAEEAGLDVSFVSLKGLNIRYCIGCLACQKTGRCVQADDTAAILEKVREAEAVVFATPVYYYGLSGQLKTLMDRLNPLYGTDYKFRDIYLIATAADTAKDTFDKTLTGLQGWVDCFEKASLRSCVLGKGLEKPNEAKGREDLMKQAFELGKNL